MIVIFSSLNDGSTVDVSRWLNYSNVDYKIIFDTDFFDEIILKDISAASATQYLEKLIDCKLENVNVFWCRKWSISNLIHKNLSNLKLNNEDYSKLYFNFFNELNTIWKFVFNTIPKEKLFGDFFNSNPTKLEQLYTANLVGLKTPQSSIVSKISHLNDEIYENDIITKSVYQAIGINFEGQSFASLTSEVTLNELRDLEFSASLIQTKVDKLFEIRVFFLEDEFYSMAIFSQQNEKTMTDFRCYDNEKPNRIIKYNLPNNLKAKILKFCSILNLTSGSFDFIVNGENEHIFLEVNPFGQFGMLSKPNNYNLEKLIANYLIKYGKC